MEEKYLGKTFKVRCGWTCEVIDYKSNKEVTIKWEEDGSVDVVNSGNLVNGVVRPTMFPSIVGVGINDMRGCEYNEDIYWKWTSMIKRAYCEHFQKGSPTYRDVEVCEEWKLFSSFHAWAEGWGDVKSLQLDKDFKGCGKLYSPENCMFIPDYLNGFMRVKPDLSDLKFTWKEQLKKYEVCVRGHTFFESSRKGDYVGVYSTKEEATFVYKKVKLETLHNLLGIYREDVRYREDVELAILDWGQRTLK